MTLFLFFSTSSLINLVVAILNKINEIYDRVEINNIFVLKEYRNKKVADQLMKKVIEDAKVNKKVNITLEVRIDNIPAINLYKKHGFVEKAIRKGYYKGTDGILMEKEMM